MLIKTYQGITTNTVWALTSNQGLAQEFLTVVYDLFSLLLFKSPEMNQLVLFIAWLDLYGIDTAKTMVADWISNNNEFIYISDAIDSFVATGDAYTQGDKTANNLITVRYYGPIGKSDHAHACKYYVNCLAQHSAIRAQFIPFTVQDTNSNDNSIDNTDNDAQTNANFGSSCPFTSRTDLQAGSTTWNSLPYPDVIIIHSNPDLWIPIIIREKAYNPAALLIGVTTFETDRILPQWQPHLPWVDYIACSNQLNIAAISQTLSSQKTLYIPRAIEPITADPSQASAPNLVDLITQKANVDDMYIFYTFNDLTNREGIDILIRTFVQSFKTVDDVILFIKTLSIPSKNDSTILYLQQLLSFYPEGERPTVIIDTTEWSLTDCNILHTVGDCYVSLARSEGYGTQAATAALAGRAVMITGFGGHLDYLVDVNYVPYRLVPASFCRPFDPVHESCLDLPSCRVYPAYLPTQQSWAHADEKVARSMFKTAYAQRWTGNPTTANYIATNFNESVVCANLVATLQSAVQTTFRVAYPSGTVDSYDQPDALFQPQRDVLDWSDLQSFTDNVPNSARVMIITAGGSGSFGDDVHETMHSMYFGKTRHVMQCNAQTFLHRDGTLHYSSGNVDFANVAPFDYLVVGGGAFISEAFAKSSILQVYHPYCVAGNIPYSVISIGCGFLETDGHTATLTSNTVAAWSPFLQGASVITARSLVDRRAIYSMIPAYRQWRVQAVADISYGVNEAFPPRNQVFTEYVVFNPSPLISMSVADVRQLVKQRLWENPGSTLVFLPTDPLISATYPSTFVASEIALVQQYFPNAIIHQGRYFSGGFLKLKGYVDASSVPIENIDNYVNIFRHAKHIITGRFYGVVMARLFNVPYDIGTTSLTRVTGEMDTPLLQTSWRISYDTVGKDIDTLWYVPDSEIGYLAKDPDTWSEEDRNTAITDVATQSYDMPSVTFVQGFSNEQLWRQRRDILLARYKV
jgi:hypothetical protein